MTSNHRGICCDFDVGGGPLTHWKLNMSRLIASLSSTVVPSQKAGERPLDPKLLFSGIGLLALIVAFVFGQPGVWF